MMLFLASGLYAKQGEVPFELAKKAAISFATKVFGETAVGPWKVYYGLDNLPAVHVFSFRLNSTGTLTEDEIMKQVTEGESLIAEWEKVGNKEMIKEGQKLKIGENNYGTIVISARYEKFLKMVSVLCKSLIFNRLGKHFFLDINFLFDFSGIQK